MSEKTLSNLVIDRLSSDKDRRMFFDVDGENYILKGKDANDMIMRAFTLVEARAYPAPDVREFLVKQLEILTGEKNDCY